VVLVQAAKGTRWVAAMARPGKRLTTPDLVVLSFLADQPMHGYQLVQELVRCEVSDWAEVSRPQVYYSLNKLANCGLIRAIDDDANAAGPERRVFTATREARSALQHALEAASWATQRPAPPFLTWVALSPRARRPAAKRMVERRRAFLTQQIRKERATLDLIRRDAGPGMQIAAAMVDLAIRTFELERNWLDSLLNAIGLQR
jgi:DNA-binding PadR family transcriptional regulator